MTLKEIHALYGAEHYLLRKIKPTNHKCKNFPVGELVTVSWCEEFQRWACAEPGFVPKYSFNFDFDAKPVITLGLQGFVDTDSWELVNYIEEGES